MAKVTIVTNLPAHYRIPVFNELAASHDVTVLYTKSKDSERIWNDVETMPDFTTRFLNTRSIGLFVVNDDIYESLSEIDPDVLIVGDNASSLLTTLVSFFYARRNNCKFVVWTEGIDADYLDRGVAGVGRKLLDLVRRYYYSRADACIGLSQSAATYLQRRSAEDSTIITGPQVMPSKHLAEPRQTYESNKTKILYLGRLSKVKNLSALIEVAKAWGGERELIIAGYGVLEDYVRQEADKSYKIRFVGYADKHKKAELYCEADLFVLPSLKDTWGLVVNESIYYGTPVVVTETSGSSSFVRESNTGVVVPPTEKGLKSGIEIALNSIGEFRENTRQYHDYVSDPRVGAKPFEDAIELVLR